MAGYAPLFDSLTTGTLCGRWPDIGLWPIVLCLKDKHGVVDVTPQYIAGVTGLPLEEVVACMKRFCEPDPYSRSGSEGGARLKLLEDHRDWGWVVVNHEKYRERARLMSKSEREVESGENQKRLKGKTAAHRRSPPENAAHHPSDADADADADADTSKRGRAKRSSRVPTEFHPDLDFATNQIPDIDAEREAQKFRDWEFKTPRSDWPAVWRNWVDRCKESGKYAKRGNGGIKWQ